MKKHVWTICFAAVLFAFTVYLALDTFVLSAVYERNATKMNLSMFSALPEGAGTQESDADAGATGTDAGATGTDADVPETDEGAVPADTGAAAPAYSDEYTYSDGNIQIRLAEYEQYGTKIYVADVTLNSAYYLRSAFAKDVYGKNVTATTSSIAAANDAILAVNGDFYGAREKGYVIRNGVVYRASAQGADVLCIRVDGTMEIVNDRDYTANELVESGVWQAFTFGPALLKNGEVVVSETDEVGRAKASNPRTAIGLLGANRFLFVVSDGRTGESEGLSLYELASFMKSLGAQTAYNLDGGGSSTLYFGGRVVNNPTSGGKIKERAVSDIVYIGI